MPADRRRAAPWLRAFLCATAFTLIAVLYWLVLRRLYPPPDSMKEVGDAFGGLIAIFSGIAAVGVILTLWAQHEELAKQRQQLLLQRTELERLAAAQESSRRELARQTALLAVGTYTAHPEFSSSEQLQRLDTLMQVQIREAVRILEDA
jgi:hypothetical protein